MKMSIHEVYYDVNGVRLRALHVGDSTAMPVIFLHGFPEYADIWHSYLHDVAAAGCYAIAIEQRGYNLSDKPHGIDAYDVDQLAADVAIIIEHELGQPAVVIGHDWGGAVAWHLAATQPQHVQHLVILNVPHPAVLAHNLQQSPQQHRKSWYMYFFQVPVIPEMIFGGNRGWLMRQMAAALIRDGQLGSLTKAAFSV
ncbi:MAG: alpha/beta fold hydrolase [Chloroflexota bacterium]